MKRAVYFIRFIAIWAILGAMFAIGAINEVNAEAFVYENGQAISLKRLGTYTITAYCPCSKCCGKYANGITASGTTATAGRTIAAPKGFSFGTKLIIDGVIYTVEDRGGAIKNKRLDIYFNSHSEALRYGKQRHEVFCYEK